MTYLTIKNIDTVGLNDLWGHVGHLDNKSSLSQSSIFFRNFIVSALNDLTQPIHSGGGNLKESLRMHSMYWGKFSRRLKCLQFKKEKRILKNSRIKKKKKSFKNPKNAKHLL